MGNVAGMASCTWGCAVQLMAAVSIESDMTFTPTQTQLLYVKLPGCSLADSCQFVSSLHSGVYCAILVLSGVVASTATRVLARLQGIYTSINILYVVEVGLSSSGCS
jgi:hypothetical protein